MLNYLDIIKKNIPILPSQQGTDENTLEYLYSDIYYMAHYCPNILTVDCGTNMGKSLVTIVAAIYNSQEKLKSLLPNSVFNTKIVTVDNGTWPGFNIDNTKNLVKLLNDITGYDIEVLVMDDIEYFKSLDTNIVNAVYVDSNHSYNHVSELLRVSLDKLSPGALICGHDYEIGIGGVVRAVDEFRILELGKNIVGTQIKNRYWWNRKIDTKW